MDEFASGEMPETLRRAIGTLRDFRDPTKDVITLATLDAAFAYCLNGADIAEFLAMSPAEKEEHFRKSHRRKEEEQARIREALDNVRKAYGKRTLIVSPEWACEGLLFNAGPVVRVTATGLYYLHDNSVYRVIYSPEELRLVREFPVHEFYTDKYRSAERVDFTEGTALTRTRLYFKGIKGPTSVRKRNYFDHHN